MIKSGYKDSELAYGLYVSSIFQSFNGECNSNRQGSLCTFIRLSGCAVRCTWCDTTETWKHNKGKLMHVSEIMDYLNSLPFIRNVTITGGEPLEQFGSTFLDLLYALSSNQYRVSVETSGLVEFDDPITEVRQMCYEFGPTFVVDYKLNIGQVKGYEDTENLSVKVSRYGVLGVLDTIKIVVHEEQDFVLLERVLKEFADLFSGMMNKPKIYVGGTFKYFDEEYFVNYFLKHKPELLSLFYGFNFQLHKYVYGSDVKGE